MDADGVCCPAAAFAASRSGAVARKCFSTIGVADIGGVNRVHPDLFRRIGDGVILGHSDAPHPLRHDRVQYQPMPISPAMEDRLMIEPFPAARRCGIACLVPRTPPFTFTACTRSLRLGHLIGGLGAPEMPALFTSTCRPPKRAGLHPAVDGGFSSGLVRNIDWPKAGLHGPLGPVQVQRPAPCPRPSSMSKDGNLCPFLGHADDTGAADADGPPGHDGGLACNRFMAVVLRCWVEVFALARCPGLGRDFGKVGSFLGHGTGQEFHPPGQPRPEKGSSTRSTPRAEQGSAVIPLLCEAAAI